jgi:hypothetical protein
MLCPSKSSGGILEIKGFLRVTVLKCQNSVHERLGIWIDLTFDELPPLATGVGIVELENLYMMENIHLKVTPIMRREMHVPKDVVRVTNDGNMHPIDLVAAVCKTDRKVSGQMIENFLNGGKLMHSNFVHENNMRLLPFKGGMKLLLLLEGPDSKNNRDRIA